MRQDPRSVAGHSEPDPQRLAVAPVRLRDPGGGSRSAALALLVVVAVLTTTVVTARLLPGEVPSTPMPQASRPAGSSPDPASAPAFSPDLQARASPKLVGDPATMIDPPMMQLGTGLFMRSVRQGEIDGQLVLVDGDLEVIEMPCDGAPTTSHTCVLLAIQGLDLPVEPGAPALPWRDEPAPGEWLVTVVEAGGLRYLGSLAASPYEPVTVDQLTRHLLARHLDEPPRTLFAAVGWLVANPPRSCYQRDPAATPCPSPPPFLAGDEPFPGGLLRSARGATVDLAGPVGVDLATAVTKGTFLVTLPAAAACRPGAVGPGCDEAAVRWVVAARYDPATAVLVSVR